MSGSGWKNDKPGACAAGEESFVEALGVASPPPEGRRLEAGESATGPTARALKITMPFQEAELLALAESGLSKEEILAELGWEEALVPSQQAVFEAIIKKGRALGRAKLKRAQFQAALGGKVSAQSHLLARMDRESGASPEGEEIEVVREVLHPGGKETQS